MKNLLLKQLLIILIIGLTMWRCKDDAEPETQKDRCRLMSYLINGIPFYMVYNENDELIANNYLQKGSNGLQFDRDNQGNLTKVFNVSKLIIGDTLIADYSYNKNILQVLRYYDRQYNINGGPSEKRILTCKFFYGKTERPDSMYVIRSLVDSSGNEHMNEPLRIDRFFYDNNGNLNKQETFNKESNGRLVPIATTYRAYDSKPNYLKTLKQINFFIDQSIPYMFSKNNLLSARREVPGKPSTEISYKVTYDGDLLQNDGMGLSEMKWSCD